MGLSQNRSRLVGRLRSRKLREREGAVLVEGVRAVSEALAAGHRPRFFVVSSRLGATEDGRALEASLGGADVEEVSDDELAALSDTEHPQGVLAVVDQPVASLDSMPTSGVVLVLDAVQDPGNVGTLVRSAVAFGLSGIACLDGTADPWGAKAVRASAGMVFRLPMWTAPFDDAFGVLGARGADVLAADAGGKPIAEALAGGGGAAVAGAADPPSGPGGLRALVLGNEGAGVRPEVRARARTTVAVPMRGPAESLNVAVAGSILMYECTRERGSR